MAKFRIILHSSPLIPPADLEQQLRSEAAARIAREVALQMKHKTTPEYWEPHNPESGICQYTHTFEVDIS